MAEGYEKTAGAAEKKAVEIAGQQAKRLPGKWASGYKRGGVHKEEAGKRDKPTSRLGRAGTLAREKVPARLAFLYAASESDQTGSRDEVAVVRHRIVRQTAGKIYIDREPFQQEEWQSREEATSEAPKTRLLSVDREVMRREGRFLYRGSYFYASEEKGIQGVNADLTARHGWCAKLDVSFPCSEESIKAAYRRLARENHPDVGGNEAEFKSVERAYREALAYFSSRDESAKSS